MADKFQNPTSETQFRELTAALKAEQARLDALVMRAEGSITEFETMTREAVARQEAQARALAQPAGGTAPRTRATVEDTTGAVRAQATAERDVTGQLERQAVLREKVGKETRAQGDAAIGTAQRAERPGGPGVTPMVGPSMETRIRASAANEAAAAEARLGAATQGSILAYHQANNELQRHGAMTTEFISAAARGQVTVRELGDQMLQTASKFGGWAAAAAGVYGVLNAFGQLTTGAIEASDAAGNLERTIEGVNRGNAAQAVTQVARESNVSMKEAGDATFLFSRTFHDVHDAAYVASLALRSYKLDGVSVTDQVKAMTAIHQQFRVTAEGMGPVWGLLANGQREFNARVNEMIPALIGSATAVKNAGGDLTDYVKILQIALRTTQLSGAQLGTAFRRAPTFLNRPTSRQTLQQLGFNPDEAINQFTDFFKQVMQRAPHMAGDARRQLFTAIFGPQFGQRMAGLSSVDPNLYKQIMGQSANSARPLADEFSKLLNTPREQIAMIGNNLQQVGAQLGQAGVLGPLGMVVRLLNSGLSATQGLLKAWSDLPGPVREVGGYLAAFATLRAIGSRFNLTGPILGISPAEQGRRQLSTGLAAERDFYAEQRLGAIRGAATAGATASQARSVAQSAAGTERAEAANAAYATALERASLATSAAAAAEEDAVLSQERLNLVRSLLARGYTAEAAAQAAGIHFMLGTQERGGLVTGAVRPVSDVARGAQNSALSGAAVTGAAAAGATAAATEAETAAMAEYSATKAGLAEQIAAQGEVMAVESGRVAAQTGMIGTAAAGMRRGLSSLSSGIGRMIPSILGIGLVVGGIIDAFQTASDAQRQAMKELDKVPASAQEARQQADQLAQQARARFGAGDYGGLGGLGTTLSGIPFVGDLALRAGTALANIVPGVDVNATTATPEGRAAQILRDLWDPKRSVGKQMQVTAGGQPYGGADMVTGGRYTLLADEAQRDANTLPHTLAARQQWVQESARLNQAANRIAAQIRARTTDPQGILALNNAQAAWRAQLNKLGQVMYADIQPIQSKDPFAQFRAMKDADVVNSMQGLSDRVKLYGGDRDTEQRLAYGLMYLTDRYRGSRNSKDLQTVISAQSAFEDAVRSDVQNLIDQANATTNKGERKSLLQAARVRLRMGMGLLNTAWAALRDSIPVLGVTYQETMAAVEQLQHMADQAGTDALNSLTSKPAFAGGQPQKSSFTQSSIIGALKTELERSLKRAGVSRSSIRTTLSHLDSLNKTINSGLGAATTGTDQLQSIRDQIAIAQAQGDPERVAQIQIAQARRDMAAAVKIKDRKSRLLAMAQAQLDLLNAENSYANAAQDAAQSAFDVAEAATWDPIQRAGIEIQKAASAMAHAHGSAAANAARAQMINAQHQQQQAIQDRVQSSFDLLESMTTDPGKQAAIELRKAQQATRFAAGTSGRGSQAYNQALAGQNRAQQKLVEQQISSRQDTIEFQLTMQQISNETAIREYRTLLNVHGITKQLRRQVLERIHALQNEGQSDFAALDLGSIRLPTPYEIRRAVLAAQQGTNVTNHYSTQIAVSDERGALAVGVQMDRYHSGTYKAIQRATGSR